VKVRQAECGQMEGQHGIQKKISVMNSIKSISMLNIAVFEQ
jgi:hypothetical protein